MPSCQAHLGVPPFSGQPLALAAGPQVILAPEGLRSSYAASHYCSRPPHLESISPYPVWLLQLLTALRTVTVLCAVRHLLLPDAVFIRLPVSPWASTDPGLKAASAQDLPTTNQRGGRERVTSKRTVKIPGVLSFPYAVPAITHPPSPPAPSWLL